MSPAAARGAVPGPVLFARYAYPPNALGYCGPDDARALLEHADGRVADGGLRALARGFDGAWPYLELIAHANGIADPLHPDVVEAYWVGGPLLAAVTSGLLGRSLEDRFAGLAPRGWSRLAELVPAAPPPQHGLHVFGVYPWVGLLRTGATAAALHVLDRCRVRAGRVVAVDGDAALVQSRPLRWDGRRLDIGPPAMERAVVAEDGYRLVPVAAGDVVALHWDWVCDVLSPARAAWLARCTRQHLDLVATLRHPGPAAVLA